MLNDAFDPAPAKSRFQADRRAQVHDFLRADAADALEACLAGDLAWSFAYKDETGPQLLPGRDFEALGSAGQRALGERVVRHATDHYAFFFSTYMMVPAYKEGRDPGLLLHGLLEFLNSPACLDAVRDITGIPAIRKADAQATRYTPGCFLRRHSDVGSGGDRREVAYVMNLTREWQPDWGGLLQFLNPQGDVIDTYLPRFNSLTLFRVPVPHCVSVVAPFAPAARYAVTGWFRSD